MNLDFDDDQQVLLETLSDFFEKESPIAAVREAEPLGFDASIWNKMSELGLASMALPEDIGGGAAGLVELGIVAELVGRYLTPVPFIESVVATRLLAAADPAALAPIASGDHLVTLAIHRAEDGIARFVPAGAVADTVVAYDGQDLLLLEQERLPDPLTPNLGCAPIAHCNLNGAKRLVTGDKARRIHRRAVSEWRALTGIALYGLANRALEIGVAYVLQRRAFGLPIATFQSVQHRLADNAAAIVGGRLLGYEAAWTLNERTGDEDRLSTMSLLFNGDIAFRTASASLHFHGGYGYTREYDIQLYFRRAKAWPLLAGDARQLGASLAHDLFD